MTVKEWVAKLHGREYGNELTQEENEQLQEDGIVAVFSCSDDLCEFCGAIDDEVGCFEGNDIWLNTEEKIANNDDSLYEHFCPDNHPDYEVIRARWHDEGNPCWTYETEIPHETFNIMEDGELLCMGIVFRLADVAPAEKEYKIMERKLPNLELVLYKAQQELALNEKWKAVIDEKRETNRYTYPNFDAEVFSQMWGNTCTGFDITQDGSPTIGGQAMTEEYTTVIHERTADFYCVFFGDRLCYVVSDASENFMNDLKKSQYGEFEQCA